MFLNYGDSEHSQSIGYMNKNVDLEINSCGMYRLDPGNDLEACRPGGRNDYQLIYIASGKGYFYFDSLKNPLEVAAGNMVLYPPHALQKYEYHGNDCATIYWIHFTGAKIDGLFQKFDLDPDSHTIFSGTESYYALAFEQIILELQLQKKFYKESTQMLFTHIIALVGRHQQELTQNRAFSQNEVTQCMYYLREHYRDNINIESYVKGRGYSTSSFFRKFKSHTGMTPLQYLLEIRLSYASKLLESTNLQINEISELIGYDNALYFSRLFHRHIGESPREYRERFRKE
ncbi:MAG: AraC family transcriptional regulator [Agathobacter sp.]|nr:AraC family transcriptional regulator [Agathobacter sp.]